MGLGSVSAKIHFGEEKHSPIKLGALRSGFILGTTKVAPQEATEGEEDATKSSPVEEDDIKSVLTEEDDTELAE
jgi:hypothetical protein